MYEPFPSSENTLEYLNYFTAPEPATAGQRFTNFILDRICMIITFLVFCVMYGLFLGFTGNTAALNRIAEGQHHPNTNLIINYLLGAVASLFYYIVSEGLMGGRTIGKLITGTRAVHEDNYHPVSFAKSFQRSLCRIIPFNAFSARSGVPWHDSLSHTTVIKNKRVK